MARPPAVGEPAAAEVTASRRTPAARAVPYFGRCRALLPATDDASGARRYVRCVPKVRRVPISRDVLLAAAVTAYGLVVTFARIGDGTIYHGPRLPNAILSALVTGTLAWRRTRPLPALTWIFAVWAVTFVIARHDLQLVAGFFVIIVLTASAAYHATRRTALACLGVGLATLALLLPPGLELSVYRIVQEALTNVLKHAQASMARVRVDYGPDAVTIDVTDDGTARPANGAPVGHGLIGMRQRAHVFGGITAAGPAPGGGWRVRAELPAEPAPDEVTA